MYVGKCVVRKIYYAQYKKWPREKTIKMPNDVRTAYDIYGAGTSEGNVERPISDVRLVH